MVYGNDLQESKANADQNLNKILSRAIYSSQKEDSQIDELPFAIFILCTDRYVAECFGCLSDRNYF